MSSKHKHEKKSNVINRTTSETLRLAELPQSAANCLSVQTVPATRKKIQNSSSSFQITGVSMTRLDFGDDSADDLDESHTDDISRVTDNETPSFSEDSRDTDEPPAMAAAVQPPPPQEEEEAGARFKVVKVATAAPFSRGRWTCFDYLDLEPSREDDDHRGAELRGGAVAAGLEAHLTSGQQGLVLDSKPAKAFPQGYSSFLCEGVQGSGGVKFVGRDFFHGQNQAGTQPVNGHGQKDDILSDIKVALTSTPASKSGSAATNNNNIDRKIEEALDAVKTHLMVAVHKEVDFLKTRVSTLEGRVNELEIENSILRVNYLLFKS